MSYLYAMLYAPCAMQFCPHNSRTNYIYKLIEYKFIPVETFISDLIIPAIAGSRIIRFNPIFSWIPASAGMKTGLINNSELHVPNSTKNKLGALGGFLWSFGKFRKIRFTFLYKSIPSLLPFFGHIKEHRGIAG